MKNSIVLFLLTFTLILSCFVILLLSLPLSHGVSEYAEYRYWIIISTYVCVIFTLILNRKNLVIYNIDKLSLLIMVLAGGIRVYVHVPNEVLYKNIILVLSLILFCATAANWSNIPSTNMNWVLIGILSCILVIPISFLESFQIDKYSLSNTLYRDHFWGYGVRNFMYTLSFVAPVEEVIFRSVLWGEMRKRQIQEEKIFWVQGLLFLSFHFWKTFTSPAYFIALFMAILAQSLLVKYSKQISPSILSHALINILTPMFVYFISIW